MKNVKKILEILRYNLKTLVSFELLYKLLSGTIFIPLFVNLFNLIMKVTGYKYLTIENILNFLLNPLTLLLIIILLLLMMVYTMFDITTVIIILNFSYQKQKIKLLDAIKISLNKCKNMFHIKNIPLAVMVLFLIPFLNIGVSSNLISTIKIPEFILEFIMKNNVLLPLFIIVMILLTILLLKWLYAIHYFVLEDLSFKEARKKSINLGKKKHLKDFIYLIIVQALLSLIYFIFVMLGILLIYLINKLLGNIIIIKSIITTIVWLFIAISFIVFTLLGLPISYAAISILFYLHKDKKKEKINIMKLEESKKKDKSNKIIKRIIWGVSLVAVVLSTLFTYGLYKGKYNLNIEYVRTIEVTAHRGSSKNYPENTMLAFKMAKEEGADWIELDVQMTKDGEIVVSHDSNLKRVTGINKNILETNYEEIKDLDAGSFLDKKYKDERIPLLKEVLEWASSNDIYLNIELKPTGKEKDFEKKVVDLILEYNFEDNCVITSQVYSVLENVKKYSLDVETVYVMSIAYGNITSLKYADNFSLEEMNVNEKLVKKIHNEGKKIYVWTINNESSIKKMIDLKVDNIITDNIMLAKDTIYLSKTSNLISEYIKLIEDNF